MGKVICRRMLMRLRHEVAVARDEWTSLDERQREIFVAVHPSMLEPLWRTIGTWGKISGARVIARAGTPKGAASLMFGLELIDTFRIGEIDPRIFSRWGAEDA